MIVETVEGQVVRICRFSTVLRGGGTQSTAREVNSFFRKINTLFEEKGIIGTHIFNRLKLCVPIILYK